MEPHPRPPMHFIVAAQLAFANPRIRFTALHPATATKYSAALTDPCAPFRSRELALSSRRPGFARLFGGDPFLLGVLYRRCFCEVHRETSQSVRLYSDVPLDYFPRSFFCLFLFLFRSSPRFVSIELSFSFLFFFVWVSENLDTEIASGFPLSARDI